MQKIHFFNLFYKKFKWQITAVAVILCSILFYASFHYDTISIGIGVLYWFFIGDSIYKHTRKNRYTFVNKDLFKLRLDGKKLDVDPKFISDVWLDNGELFLQRINRVDVFKIGHLNPQHLEKLVQIIKSHRDEVLKT